jgi:hypothetical protein
MPTVVYRALYQPAAGCSTCAGGYAAPYAASYAAPYTASYAVTTYRPFLGTYQTRLVPYTTYRPLYTPAVSYGYVGYSPCTSCAPYAGCSSCSGGCGTVMYGAPVSGCSSCSSGGCGAVMYGAPASGCSSCGVPAASAAAPEAAPQATPPTFQKEVGKPANGSDLKPIPQQGEVQPNSLPAPAAPALPDPNNRRVASAASGQVRPAAWNAPAAAADDDDGWRPAR